MRQRSHVSSAVGAASCSGVAAVVPRGPRRHAVVRVECFQRSVRAPQQLASAMLQDKKVRVAFKLPYRCSFGQEVCLVGSGEPLGNWDVKKGVRMNWTDGDVWEVEFEMAPGPDLELEYKYVVRNPDGNALAWKPGSNLQIRVPVLLAEERAIAEGVRVRDAWDGSVHDIELEVTALASAGASAAASGGKGGAFTAEQEAAAVQSAMDRALDELNAALGSSYEMQEVLGDPTAPEILQADRLVAAATRKAIAMSRALSAAQSYSALPASAGTANGNGLGSLNGKAKGSGNGRASSIGGGNA